MKKTVIIGFGNLLMGDDGVGIHVIQELCQRNLPAGVEMVDGGVASYTELQTVREADRLMIVDAVTGSGAPGDIYCLAPEEIQLAVPAPAYSLHDFSLAEALCLAQKSGDLPPTTIYGIEPACFDMKLELTPAVATAAQSLVQLICQELQGEYYA
jgi:hydrogenase maturation protease